MHALCMSAEYGVPDFILFALLVAVMAAGVAVLGVWTVVMWRLIGMDDRPPRAGGCASSCSAWRRCYW